MLRTLLTGLAVVVAIVVAGPLGLLAAWISGSPRPLYALAFPSVRFVMRVAGVRLTVRGRDNLDPSTTYLFVANHVSNVDPPVLMVAIGRNIRALAKAEVFRLPVFGSVLRAADFPAVHRNDRERAMRAVDMAAAALREGHDFLVFAEGTRSPDGTVQAFKKGPFVMAIKAQVPVAPIVIRGTRAIQPKGSLRVRPGDVTAEFLPPVPTAGMEFDDRNALRRRVHEMMTAALADGSGVRRDHGSGSPAAATSGGLH